jgi:MSHA biogenesis protein MshQ
VWLNVLTILRRGCWAAAAWLLAWSGSAAAANANFDGSAVSNCTLNSKTYTCSSLNLNGNDQAIIASGYTVILNNSFAPAWNNGLTMSGTAALQVTGSNSLDLSSANPNSINLSGGNITVGGNFTSVAAARTITVNITAGSITTGGEGVTINGTVTAVGAINFGNKVTVNGPVNAATITTGGEYTKITGNVTISGAINFGSNTTVTGSVSGASISTGSATSISGALTVTGTADLGSFIKIGGNLKANVVKTGSPATISGAIDSNTTVELGSGTTVGGSIKGTTVVTGSPVTLNGSVTASTSFNLASGSTVTGNITSPSITLAASNSTVKGDISTSGTLDIGSGNTVTGSVTAGGLIMRSSGVVINGTTKISGDVDMGSGSTINGDLSARDVITRSSNAVINGNAAVNSIYIDWYNSVTKTITCTGALNGSVPCSCVSKPQSYSYSPTCAAAPSGGIHHFQITHSGIGLTCQPQTVQLKACTNDSCTTTSTTATDVTLSPGGGVISLTGSGSASVRYATATDANGVTLTATASGVSNATVCPNANTGTNNCQMIFKDEGLVLSAPDHISMTPNVKLNVQALKTSPQGSCVPLVQNATVPVKFSCAYINPLPANANQVPVVVNGANISCSNSSSTDVSLAFDNNGLATPSLQYSEVGQTRITAAYAANGLGASGAVPFMTAPAKIKIEPIRINNPTAPFSPTAFARASEPFKLRLTALNYNDVATRNFGRESPTPQNFAIPTPVLTNPVNGNFVLTTGTYKGIVNGVADATDGVPGQWRFDETGTLRFTVKLADSSTYYLGNTAASGFNIQATADLTFVPDHFDVALPLGTPMTCALVGGLNNPCGSLNAAGRFIYSKQPFTVVLSAYTGIKDSATNLYVPAQNYVGTAARQITLSAWSVADTSVPIASGTTGVGDFKWSQEPLVTSRFSFAYDAVNKKNLGTLAANGNLPSYDFRLAPTAPTTMVIRAIDSDGATSQGFAEPLLTVVSGQMGIPNVSGSLNRPVLVQPLAQYWNGSSYVFNSQFQLASIPMYTTPGTKTYYIQFSKCMNGLDTSSNNSYTCPGGSALKLASPETIAFVNGKGSFYLAQPTPALTRNGSVDITLTNAAFQNDNDPDKKHLIRYLPSNNGRIVFGVYRSGPIIYSREVYN